MYWQEDKEHSGQVDPGNMVDVVFAIRCKTLPVDHAHALASAVMALLPWLREEPGAGVHTIHVAESGNGWQRPGDILHPSRRTRLSLRVPRHRSEDCKALTGQTLDVGGHTLTVGDQVDTRPLSMLTTLFTRYLVSEEEMDEHAFLNRIAGLLEAMQIKPKKMLCGREQILSTGTRSVRTRSLMIAELEVEEAIRLQNEGLGSHRYMGCGIFIPHKSIKEVSN